MWCMQVGVTHRLHSPGSSFGYSSGVEMSKLTSPTCLGTWSGLPIVILVLLHKVCFSFYVSLVSQVFQEWLPSKTGTGSYQASKGSTQTGHVTSTTFYWSQQVTQPAQIPKILPLDWKSTITHTGMTGLLMTIFADNLPHCILEKRRGTPQC